MSSQMIATPDITQPKQRNSNLELYRIIVMLAIVAHHYVVNSGLNDIIYADIMSARSIFLLIFGAFGKTGINCFVLITGYFMCKSNITLKKYAKLIFEVEFYKIVIWLIFLICGREQFSLTSIVKVLLPISSVADGFTSAYLLFFLFIPFLNILVKSMNEKQHVTLIGLCLFTYTILGTIPKITVEMNYVSWFIVLYFIGSLFNMHPRAIYDNTKLWGLITLAMIIVSVASVVIMAWIYTKINLGGPFYFLADSNKVLAVLLAVSSFLFFRSIKIKNSKIINSIAASTFGVLLIHANSGAMRQWLWVDLLDNVGMYQADLMILHAIGCVLAIFIICATIDHIRIQLLEKPLFKAWDKHVAKRKQVFTGGAVIEQTVISPTEVATDIAPNDTDINETSTEENNE